MEYTQMLSEPQLIAGLGTLLKDEDPLVIKRTIRVFANVYRHSLNMLSTGELDEQTFTNAWPTVSSVANDLIEIIENSENEGITVHIVRFLEAAVLAHILSDISRYPDILSKTSPIVSKIVGGLSDLLDTDYVGGSAFIVGIRAMITIACYKEDMRNKVIDLIERKIAKPAATLFDHHIRSLNKMLQRNLFRLLRREQSQEGKDRLVEMMVKVGVKRRLLGAWAPSLTHRKRSAPSQMSADDIIGRTTPPHKRSRDGDITPPRTPEYQYVPTSQPNSQYIPTAQSNSQAIPEYIPTKIQKSSHSQSNSRPNSQPNSRPNSKPNSPSRSPVHSHSGRSTPERVVNTSKPDEINVNFDLLQKIINSHSKTQEESSIEVIAKALEKPQAVEFVLEYMDQLQDIPDEELLMDQLREVGSDENAKKETLAALLVKILPKNVIDELREQHEKNEVKASTPISPTSSPIIQVAPVTSSSPFFSNQDVDLRNLLNPKGGDVDMRMLDPRNMQQQQLNTNDPRMMNQTSSQDPRSKPSELPHMSVAQNSSRDPRSMAGRDPRRPAESRDPRVAMSIMNNQEMGRRSPNFMIERNLQDVDRRSPVFMQDMGRRSPNFMQNAQDMGRRSPNFMQNAQDMGRRSPNFMQNSPDMGRRSPNFMSNDPRMRNERVPFGNGHNVQNYNHGAPLGNLNPNTTPRFNGMNMNNNMQNNNFMDRNRSPVNNGPARNNNFKNDQNGWGPNPPQSVLNRAAMRMSAS